MERTDVLISGGGFVGLALALVLSRTFQGELRVVVIDAGPLSVLEAGQADPRASAIAAGPRRLLETIGAWAAVEPFAEPVVGIDLTDSSLEAGVRPILLSYDTMLPDGTPGMTIVENTRLRSALLAAVAAAPGVRLVPKTTITTFVPERSRALAVLSDGRTISAALVVAAEGRRSLLRDMAGIKVVGWSYPQSGLVTTVHLEESHRGRAMQHFLPAGPFAMLPLPGNRACVTWSETQSEAERLTAGDDATYEAAVDQRVGGRFGRVRMLGPRRAWPLEMHLARSLIADRLALAGDSARGVHPIAGQGLNLGLRDVAALAECIAEGARAGQDIGAAQVLEPYQRWRRADGAMSAAGFDALNRLFSNDWAILRTARDAGLGLVDRLPALKQMLVGEASGLTGDVPRLLRGAPL